MTGRELMFQEFLDNIFVCSLFLLKNVECENSVAMPLKGYIVTFQKLRFVDKLIT